MKLRSTLEELPERGVRWEHDPINVPSTLQRVSLLSRVEWGKVSEQLNPSVGGIMVSAAITYVFRFFEFIVRSATDSLSWVT